MAQLSQEALEPSWIPAFELHQAFVCSRRMRADAFTNPALEPYLREEGVEKLWILGVFAEGCIRATALSARKRGFEVVVPQAEIATNSTWKAAFALWALRRGGVTIIPNVRSAAK